MKELQLSQAFTSFVGVTKQLEKEFMALFYGLKVLK